jgi:hypothetical protein
MHGAMQVLHRDINTIDTGKHKVKNLNGFPECPLCTFVLDQRRQIAEPAIR